MHFPTSIQRRKIKLLMGAQPRIPTVPQLCLPASKLLLSRFRNLFFCGLVGLITGILVVDFQLASMKHAHIGTVAPPNVPLRGFCTPDMHPPPDPPNLKAWGLRKAWNLGSMKLMWNCGAYIYIYIYIYNIYIYIKLNRYCANHVTSYLDLDARTNGHAINQIRGFKKSSQIATKR